MNGASATEDMMRLVRDVGFPIAVATILLWWTIARIVPAVDRLAEAVAALSGAANAQAQASQVVLDEFRKELSTAAENNRLLREQGLLLKDTADGVHELLRGRSAR